VTYPMTFDRIRPGDHVCWTLDDGDERLEAMVGYVRAPRLARLLDLVSNQTLPASVMEYR